MSIAAGGSNLATFKYDFDGRRVQQQITSTTATHSLWDVTTRYGDVLLETAYSGPTPNAKASYVYANGAVAELLSQKKNGATNPEYFLLDGQGSVRGLTSISGALVTGSEFSYDTFGKPVGSADLTKSSYLYTGQQYESVSQLYDLRARYYSPQQGRFLSQDTWPVDFKNPRELNRYGYTANNPVNYSDSSGYMGETAFLSGLGSFSSRVKFAAGVSFIASVLITAITFAVFLVGAETLCSFTVGYSGVGNYCTTRLTTVQTSWLGVSIGIIGGLAGLAGVYTGAAGITSLAPIILVFANLAFLFTSLGAIIWNYSSTGYVAFHYKKDALSYSQNPGQVLFCQTGQSCGLFNK